MSSDELLRDNMRGVSGKFFTEGDESDVVGQGERRVIFIHDGDLAEFPTFIIARFCGGTPEFFVREVIEPFYKSVLIHDVEGQDEIAVHDANGEAFLGVEPSFIEGF